VLLLLHSAIHCPLSLSKLKLNATKMAGDGEGELTVLVCCANIGNAEPTPHSFGKWVPDDGEIEGPLSETKYTIEADRAAEVSASLRRVTGKKFDIIVLGMQEAAFMAPKTKKECTVKPASVDSSRSDTEKGVIMDTGEKSSSGNPIDIVEAGVVSDTKKDTKKEGGKPKNKFLRKLAKGNLLRKGLTTTKDYQS